MVAVVFKGTFITEAKVPSMSKNLRISDDCGAIFGVNCRDLVV